MEKVILQTDWFAQPEHGGFYQALALGFYREAGLEVEILSGGPNSMSVQKILKGSAHFAMNRADTIYSMRARDIPVKMVMATLQHDPQGILLHESNPVDSFSDLDGKKVMAIPGLTWIDWLEARYGVEMNIVPHDFGMERFLNDSDFIQQCLITNEPYYAKANGVPTKVLRLADSGFDPYHGIYALDSYLEENPETVKRFIQASIRGWREYINGDPSPAFTLIAERNPKMTKAFMDFSRKAMIDNRLVQGFPENRNAATGMLDPARMNRMVKELKDYDVLENYTTESWFTTSYLPPELQNTQ